MWNERSPFQQPTTGFGPGAPFVTKFGRVLAPVRTQHMAPAELLRPAQHQLRLATPFAHRLAYDPRPGLRGLGAADGAVADPGTVTAGILGAVVGGALTGAVVGAVGTHGWKGTAPGALGGAGIAGIVGGLGALFTGQPMVGLVSALGGCVGLLAGWTVSGHQKHRE